MPEHLNHNFKGSVYHERSLYGRKKGKALSIERQTLLETFFPQIEIKASELKQDHSQLPASFFKNQFEQHWLEIGFGNGEHLAALMRQNPKIGYLGAEPFINGVTSLLKDIQKDEVSNLRILKDDAMMLAKSLQPHSLDGMYVLNPDPWHKKRHHKRRLINTKNLDIFARILKPGGQLILSTDVPYLADWMLTHTLNHPAFTWTAQSTADWETPPKGWIPTRYEQKRAKGAHKMTYLIFERKPLHSS